jgi:N-acetylglucosamine kinase-like BadF-type ATPase
MKSHIIRQSTRPRQGLYLGVDGGGTRTTGWAGDRSGVVIGRATAGPANPIKVGLAAAEREILTAAREALQAAGRGDLQGVCLGLAGADRAEIIEPLMKWLRRCLPARSHLVTTDAAITLEAASGRLPCVVVIAGTGSIACARDGQGNLVRAGGWGATFDDAGSGFDIGRNAVRAALRAWDGSAAPTRLLKTLPRALGLRDIRETVGLGLPPAGIAALAPEVIKSARAADGVARRILEDASSELALLAATLIRRLGLEDRPVSVVCSGGLLQASAVMRRTLQRHLQSLAPQARVSRLNREPVEGALALARRLS